MSNKIKTDDEGDLGKVEAIRNSLKALQDSFLETHHIQPVIAQALQLLNGGEYRQAWEILEQAQDIATLDYNVFGLGGFVGIFIPVPLEEMVELLRAKHAAEEQESRLLALEENLDLADPEQEAELASMRGVAEEGEKAERRLAEIRKNQDDATVPRIDYFIPIRSVQEIRLQLAAIMESDRQCEAPVDERVIIEEAADIVRRYDGEPDRYDPRNIEDLELMIQHEYTGSGRPLTPRNLARIKRVMEKLYIVYSKKLNIAYCKPVLTPAAEQIHAKIQEEYLRQQIAALEQGIDLPSAYRRESDRVASEAVGVILGVLAMSSDSFIDHARRCSSLELQAIESIDLIYEITRLGLAGRVFPGSRQELAVRLKTEFTSQTVDLMLSMVILRRDDALVMDHEGIMAIFTAYRRLEASKAK